MTTGKVGDKKRSERIAKRFTAKFCKAAPLAEAGEFHSGLESSIRTTLATVRKEELEAAKRVVTAAVPAINFGNGEYLRREILKALEASANGVTNRGSRN